MPKNKKSSKLTSMTQPMDCRDESMQPKTSNSLSSKKSSKSKPNGYSNCR